MFLVRTCLIRALLAGAALFGSGPTLRAQIWVDPTPLPSPLGIKTLILEEDRWWHRDLWAISELGGGLKVLGASSLHEERFLGTLGGRILYYRWPYRAAGNLRELVSVKPDGSASVVLSSQIDSRLGMAPPELDAARGRVVFFQTSIEGRPEIVSVLPDGSDRKVLLKGTGTAKGKTGWFDLRKVANGKLWVHTYYSDTDIDLKWVDVDTGVAHALATAGDPELFNAYDPAAGTVYYQQQTGGQQDLWSVQLDGSRRQVVAHRSEVDEACADAQGGRALVVESTVDPVSKESINRRVYACDSAGGGRQTVWEDADLSPLGPIFSRPDVVLFCARSLSTNRGEGPYFYNLSTGLLKTWPTSRELWDPLPSFRYGSPDRLVVEMPAGGSSAHPALWSVAYDGSTPRLIDYEGGGRLDAIQNGRVYYGGGPYLNQILWMGLDGGSKTYLVDNYYRLKFGTIIGDSLFYTATEATATTTLYRAGATWLESPRKLRTLEGNLRIVGVL